MKDADNQFAKYSFLLFSVAADVSVCVNKEIIREDKEDRYVCMYVCVFSIRAAVRPRKSPRRAQDALS